MNKIFHLNLINIILNVNLIICFGENVNQTLKVFDSKVCDQDLYFKYVLKPEIKSKSSVVNEIIDLVLNKNEKNKTYEELAQFVDTFGGRLSGSEALENSTNYLIEKLKKENIDDIHTEDVLIPKWERGSEWASMTEPRTQKLSLLGLVGSIPTPEEGITSELIVFKSLEDLNEVSNNDIKDKIVLFDSNKVNGSYVKFTLEATRAVAEAQGLAVLFKSLSSDVPYSTKGGVIRYYSTNLQIPAASITVEDSEMLSRIRRRGIKVVVNLYLESTFHGMIESRNLIAELKGTQNPDETVIVSAHLDSYDIGQGALDDGGGIFIALKALTILKKLKIKHKRTLRMVLFTGEEVGRFGSKDYIQVHKESLVNISLIMNSNLGTLPLFGLTFSGTNTRSQCVVKQTLRLLSSINSPDLIIGKGYDSTQSDANEFIKEGVPAIELTTKNPKYLSYPHTEADTMSAMDAYVLDLCTIVWTTISYVMSDLSIKLGKDH